jgi:hypothetical protein
MPILTDPIKKYLLNDDKKGYTAETKSAYNRRIIDYTIRGISDLSLLAEKLPEDMQAQVFEDANGFSGWPARIIFLVVGFLDHFLDVV